MLIHKSSKSAMKKPSSKITISAATQVAAGTPAGEWFRRYWLAVGITEELRDIPGPRS